MRPTTSPHQVPPASPPAGLVSHYLPIPFLDLSLPFLDLSRPFLDLSPPSHPLLTLRAALHLSPHRTNARLTLLAHTLRTHIEDSEQTFHDRRAPLTASLRSLAQ